MTKSFSTKNLVVWSVGHLALRQKYTTHRTTDIRHFDKLPIANFQIAEHLCLMDGQQRVDGFHLHDDAVGDKKIQSVTAVQSSSLVVDRNGFLLFEGDIPQRQFPRQTLLVSRLQ